MTTPQELIDCIRRSVVDDPANAAALDCLSSAAPSADVSESPVELARLLSSYRRRLRRAPADVIGLSSTVERMESMGDPTVLLAVLANDGRVVSVVRTREGDLIGCVIGPDRRFPAEPDESSSGRR